MKKYVLVSIIALVSISIFTAASCKNKKHNAVVIDSSLYEALNDTFISEQALLKTESTSWNLAKSQAFNKKLLPAVSAGREFNNILSNWKSGQPIPAALHDAITGITAALQQISVDMPDGTTKSKILSNLANAESIILTALDLTLAVKG